jgi:hypothetical protein
MDDRPLAEIMPYVVNVCRMTESFVEVNEDDQVWIFATMLPWWSFLTSVIPSLHFNAPHFTVASS